MGCFCQVITTSTEPNERETSFLIAAQILWCFFISPTFLNTQQLIWNSVSVTSGSTNEDTNTWIHLVFWNKFYDWIVELFVARFPEKVNKNEIEC